MVDSARVIRPLLVAVLAFTVGVGGVARGSADEAGSGHDPARAAGRADGSLIGIGTAGGAASPASPNHSSPAGIDPSGAPFGPASPAHSSRIVSPASSPPGPASPAHSRRTVGPAGAPPGPASPAHSPPAGIDPARPAHSPWTARPVNAPVSPASAQGQRIEGPPGRSGGRSGEHVDGGSLPIRAGVTQRPPAAEPPPAAPPSAAPGSSEAVPGPDAPAVEPGPPAPSVRYGWPLRPVPRVAQRFRAPADRYTPGHRGADLVGAVGQPVLAARGGVVAFAGPLAGRGVVSVLHPDGLRTTYEPVTAAVAVGAVVERGTVLGTLDAGHPGCPAAACLHWGVRRGEADYLDPLVLVGPGTLRLLPPPRRWPWR